MQKLQLAIPEPCHQDWNKMSPNQQGRFCGSCAKTVVDFSSMSDAQLLGYFEKLKNENVCGRVYPDQLERSIKTLPIPRKKIFIYWQYVIAFFIMLGKGQSAKAQGEIKVKTVMQPDTSGKKIKVQDDMRVMLGKIVAKPGAATEKKWSITDQNGQPVPYATLQFFPSGATIVADENGRAEVRRHQAADSVTISAVGYKVKTLPLTQITDNIVLDGEQLLLGEVVVSSILDQTHQSSIAGGISFRMVEEKSLIADTIQLIRSVFDPTLTIYPNPVSKGGTLSLSFQLKKTGAYKIDCYDAAGRLLLQENYLANTKMAHTKIKIPEGWGLGTYFIKLYDEKGQQKGKGKFMVQ